MKLGRWTFVLLVAAVLLLILVTSASFQQCMNDPQESGTGQTFQEYVTSLPVLLSAARTCVGGFFHDNGDPIIAVFTIILGIATMFLWFATRDLVAEAEKTGKKQLTAATALATATQDAANAAKEAAEYARRAASPYVGLIVSKPDRNFNTWRVTFRLINFGSSAATISRLYAELVEGKDAPPTLDMFQQIALPADRVLLPAKPKDAMNVQAAISSQIERKLSEQFTFLWLIGSAEFDDVHGASYVTEFCWRYDGREDAINPYDKDRKRNRCYRVADHSEASSST